MSLVSGKPQLTFSEDVRIAIILVGVCQTAPYEKVKPAKFLPLSAATDSPPVWCQIPRRDRRQAGVRHFLVGRQQRRREISDDWLAGGGQCLNLVVAAVRDRRKWRS